MSSDEPPCRTPVGARWCPDMPTLVIVLIALGLTLVPAHARAQIADVPGLCADRPPATGVSPFTVESARPERQGSRSARPASDLNCIDLFSTTRGGDAAGVIEVRRPWSPYGVTVTPEGRHRHELVAHLARLPDPSTLGPYTAYVAWATPLTLDPVIRLTEVRNGRNELGEVALNKYLVWVTAEASPDVTERSGPLVVRGRSPSSRMEAHDLLALAPSAEEGRGMEMGTGVGMGMEMASSEGEWTMPPMYDGVPMLPGVMNARPRVT